jgi:hypothetical protein
MSAMTPEQFASGITFGEVESVGTFTREMQKLSPSDGAGFPTLLRTGKRGETFNPPRFTKSGPRA